MGYGSAIHPGSVWSKSVAQSATRGRSVVIASLRDRDRVFGAVGRGPPRLVFERVGHQAVVELERVAEIVDIEELGCQGVAAIVALALLAIDMDPHLAAPLVSPHNLRADAALREAERPNESDVAARSHTGSARGAGGCPAHTYAPRICGMTFSIVGRSADGLEAGVA